VAFGRGVLATLYRYEIRMLLRDTRTILIAVVAPVLLFPLMIAISRSVERRQTERIEQATYTYAVTGSEEDFAFYRVESALLFETFDIDTTRSRASFLMDRSPNPDSLLEEGSLHLVVEGMTADEFRRARRRELDEQPGVDSAGLAELARIPDVPVLRIHFRADRDVSLAAMDRLTERLGQVQRRHRDSVYRAHGLGVDPDRVGQVDVQNVASAERESGAFLGLVLTPILLFLMLTGGSIVAVDAISGEKERGTLETLLTTAARRSEIVSAKQLAVVTVGVVVTGINLVNLLVYVVLDLIDLPQSLAVALSPLSLVVLLDTNTVSGR
jgi:sodium transport system permease protein